MTRKILCTPHDERGKPVYGTRYEFDIRAIPNEGPERAVSGVLELCDQDARPLIAAIEYAELVELASRVDSSPPAPPAGRKAGPPKTDTPAAPETPDSWECLDCGDGTVYIGQQRTGHVRVHHPDKRIWEIPWRPLFEASGWSWCGTCGYGLKTPSGLRQHHQIAGHTGVRDDELTTETGRAMNRAAEARS